MPAPILSLERYQFSPLESRKALGRIREHRGFRLWRPYSLILRRSHPQYRPWCRFTPALNPRPRASALAGARGRPVASTREQPAGIARATRAALSPPYHEPLTPGQHILFKERLFLWIPRLPFLSVHRHEAQRVHRLHTAVFAAKKQPRQQKGG